MDQMVLKVQQWLNTTYGGNANYKRVTEDGITGNSTVSALIRALQIEIGIPSPDGVFGKATLNACPTISPQYGSKHEVYIVQGALYCKGYNPYGFDGGYGNGVMNAIKKFQSDAGLINQDGKASPRILQALLNTDAYILIYRGDSKMRTIQQNLNRDYNSVIGLIPTNGIYARSTNTALIKALQHEEGNTPDGIWGTNTKNACPTIPGSRSTRNFVLLLQYALYCNGYDPNGFDGAFGSGLQNAIRDFQSFVGLSADGSAGPQTWASLLVSYGDPSRKGIACDCSTTVTSEKAAALVANGYKIVGRYLTGKYAMTASELQTIFENNLRVIPIFEVGGYKLNYFNSIQGMVDSKTAILAANALGIPDNTIIYFAVDFDALDQDVTNHIIPYFESLKTNFSEITSTYKIGIYAPRNVCSRISAAGYSCSSFVCDMSSGFSGNLGYKLPSDWAFDQISTITVSNRVNSIGIDNDISSGKNLGISKFKANDVISLIKKLDIAAENYMLVSISGADTSSRNKLVHNFIRSYRYNGVSWFLTLGSTENGFINYLNENESDLLSKIMPYIKSKNTLASYLHNIKTDLPHLSATTLGYSNAFLVPNFWTGWGGDIATAMRDVIKLSTLSANKTLDELAVTVIGNDAYSCSRMDIENDIDAIYFANNINEDTLGYLLDKYFLNVSSSTRKTIILSNLGFNNTPTENQLSNCLYDMITGSNGFNKPIEGSHLEALATYNAIKPTAQVIKATTLAFAKYILNVL